MRRRACKRQGAFAVREVPQCGIVIFARLETRYVLNSSTLKSFKYGSDGSLTIYVQKDSPAAAKKANWLPAPDGTFYAILRINIPAPGVVNGTWKKPQMQRAR
jgi:hypothetical protein